MTWIDVRDSDNTMRDEAVRYFERARQQEQERQELIKAMAIGVSIIAALAGLLLVRL